MLPSDEELTALWVAALDPQKQGLVQAVAADLASFTGEPEGVVLDKMERGKDAFRELWEQSSVNAADSASLAHFYSTQFVEAYELANWHAGRTNGVPPLNYARAACIVKQFGLKRALDFGSGIGSGALCLAAAGASVDCADIASDLLRFVRHRLDRHGVRATTYDLNTTVPPRESYDLITCFDVLEHLPDQHAKLTELLGYLKPEGYLCVNLMADSRDAERPMHISSVGNVLSLIRRTSAVPIWAFGFSPWQVIQRKPWGRLYNALASLKDRFDQRRAPPPSAA